MLLLLDSQVNELLHAVDKSGIPQSRFFFDKMDGEWAGYQDGEPTPAFIVHSGWYFFAIDYEEPLEDAALGIHSEGGYQVYFCPAEHTRNEHVRHLSWPQVLPFFRNWLRYLRRELHYSDPEVKPPIGSLALDTSQSFGGAIRQMEADKREADEARARAKGQQPKQPAAEQQKAKQEPSPEVPQPQSKVLRLDEVSVGDLFGAVKRLSVPAAWKLGAAAFIALSSIASAGAYIAHYADARRIDDAKWRADSLARVAAAAQDSLAMLRKAKPGTK